MSSLHASAESSLEKQSYFLSSDGDGHRGRFAVVMLPGAAFSAADTALSLRRACAVTVLSLPNEAHLVSGGRLRRGIGVRPNLRSAGNAKGIAVGEAGSAMDVSLRFEILGRVRGWRGEHELDLGPGKQRAVLAVLLINANRPTPTTAIVQLLRRAAK
jgi:hypothetical protein